MRYLHFLLVIFLLLFFPVIGSSESLTVEIGFKTKALPNDSVDTLLKNIHLSTFNVEPQEDAIDCFDVNIHGLIAIGHSDSTQKQVSLYSSNGDFQHGYSFEYSGSFGVELDNCNNLFIYLVRSNIALVVNTRGEIEQVLEIQDTIENTKYWDHSVFSNRRNINGTEYILQNDMGILNFFTSTYSQLISMDENGKTTMLYDANSTQWIKMGVSVVGIIIFVSLAVVFILRDFIRLRHNMNSHKE